MIRPCIVLFLISGLLVSSCRWFEKEPELNSDFMTHCDCMIYENEVSVQNFDFGQVEFIDTSKASGCAKEQLKNVYLLYHDSICVAVYNEHPKDNIKLIEDLIKQYKTDTTKLAGFVKSDSSIRITVDRLCKDKLDKNYYGTYVNWRVIEYSTLTNPFIKTKDEINTTWYKWTD